MCLYSNRQVACEHAECRLMTFVKESNMKLIDNQSERSKISVSEEKGDQKKEEKREGRS